MSLIELHPPEAIVADAYFNPRSVSGSVCLDNALATAFS